MGSVGWGSLARVEAGEVVAEIGAGGTASVLDILALWGNPSLAVEWNSGNKGRSEINRTIAREQA